MTELLGFICIVLIVSLVIFIPAHILIWVVSGLFGVDWSDKYWYVFAGLFILSGLKPSSSSNKRD